MTFHKRAKARTDLLGWSRPSWVPSDVVFQPQMGWAAVTGQGPEAWTSCNTVTSAVRRHR